MKHFLAVLIAAAAAAQTYEARHDHLRGFCRGDLIFNDQGVAFESAKKGHSWKLAWLDVQQLRILDNGDVDVLTYQDRKWRLGADRAYHLRVADRPFAAQVTPMLENRLGRRFVAGAPAEVKPLWEIPAKHLLRFGGVEGTLVVAADRIQFRAAKPGASREWMLTGVESISTSDPYQLTLVPYERPRRDFNFQLKQSLDSEQYNRLWRRLEAAKGLQVLSLADEKPHER